MRFTSLEGKDYGFRTRGAKEKKTGSGWPGRSAWHNDRRIVINFTAKYRGAPPLLAQRGAGVVGLRDAWNFRGLAALGEGGVDRGGVRGNLLAHGAGRVVDG